MAEPAFAQAFLRRCVEIEKIASKADLELLDRTVAFILDDPTLPERFPAFYDPQRPSFLFRAGRS